MSIRIGVPRPLHDGSRHAGPPVERAMNRHFPFAGRALRCIGLISSAAGLPTVTSIRPTASISWAPWPGRGVFEYVVVTTATTKLQKPRRARGTEGPEPRPRASPCVRLKRPPLGPLGDKTSPDRRKAVGGVPKALRGGPIERVAGKKRWTDATSGEVKTPCWAPGSSAPWTRMDTPTPVLMDWECLTGAPLEQAGASIPNY